MNTANQGDADIDTEIGPIKNVTAAEAERAALVVADYAEGVEDCARLLSMLGLAPSTPPPCSNCGDPIGRHMIFAQARPAGDGMCSRCFDAAKDRARRKRVAEGVQ